MKHSEINKGNILRVAPASRFVHHSPAEKELWVYYHSDEFGITSFVVEDIDYSSSNKGYWVRNSKHAGILIPFGSIIFVLEKEVEKPKPAIEAAHDIRGWKVMEAPVAQTVISVVMCYKDDTWTYNEDWGFEEDFETQEEITEYLLDTRPHVAHVFVLKFERK